jgi:hypothetical protein
MAIVSGILGICGAPFAIHQVAVAVERPRAHAASREHHGILGSRHAHDARDLTVGIDHQHRQRLCVDEQRGVAAERDEAREPLTVGIRIPGRGVGHDLHDLEGAVQE